MSRTVLALLLLPLGAEVRPIRLAEAIDLAMKQNPDAVLARLEQRSAAEAVRAARDPFYPKLFAGSGLAYSAGFPMSIEGSAPSVVESRAIASIYNRPQRLLLEKAKQDEKTVGVVAAMRQEAAAYRAAVAYIEAGRIAAALPPARDQLSGWERAAGATSARVAEGRELPIAVRRAELRIAQARLRVRRLENARHNAEAELALLLGMNDGDLARPAEPGAAVAVPLANEADSVLQALKNSREVQRLESAMKAKGLEASAHAAERLPRIDLVAQYGLFARFNNYDKFFNRFQRHNGQLGMSFQVPLLPSQAAQARRAAAEVEGSALRTQWNAERQRTAVRARQAWQQVEEQSQMADVAQLDLEVAREQTSVVLARAAEGRAAQAELEQVRLEESEKWMALFDARYALDRARLNLLHETGTLAASLGR